MSDAWNVRYEDEVDGKTLRPGVSFALEGESGKRYDYIRTITNGEGESWVDCFGGNSGRQMSRAVHHDQIKPHSIKAKPIKRIEVPGPVARRGRR